jgi:class 3 adenylate cyclase
VTGAPAAAPAAAAGYTPRHLAEGVLSARSARDGERKQVTVMFVDVKGSVGLSARVDSEDWHEVMDRFFALAGEAVHRFEGTLNQYTGDGSASWPTGWRRSAKSCASSPAEVLRLELEEHWRRERATVRGRLAHRFWQRKQARARQVRSAAR